MRAEITTPKFAPIKVTFTFEHEDEIRLMRYLVETGPIHRELLASLLDHDATDAAEMRSYLVKVLRQIQDKVVPIHYPEDSGK